jgi:hypothetical protein
MPGPGYFESLAIEGEPENTETEAIDTIWTEIRQEERRLAKSQLDRSDIGHMTKVCRKAHENLNCFVEIPPKLNYPESIPGMRS